MVRSPMGANVKGGGLEMNIPDHQSNSLVSGVAGKPYRVHLFMKTIAIPRGTPP